MHIFVDIRFRELGLERFLIVHTWISVFAVRSGDHFQKKNRLIFRLYCNMQVGFNMRKVSKGNVTIKLWDLGGQPRFRSMWERYCRGVSAIVYVIIHIYCIKNQPFSGSLYSSQIFLGFIICISRSKKGSPTKGDWLRIGWLAGM